MKNIATCELETDIWRWLFLLVDSVFPPEKQPSLGIEGLDLSNFEQFMAPVAQVQDFRYGLNLSSFAQCGEFVFHLKNISFIWRLLIAEYM